MRGYGNYDFVIDSSFRPYSFKEMLAPLAMYKEEYEKVEDKYQDLRQKADVYSYLGKKLEDSPDSKAAQIYKGYADDLRAQAEDLAKNGLSINNRRALTGLRQRYQSEIGQLDAANTRLEEERKRRATMWGKDQSMLYATDNLDIDQFLDNETPNLYGISGNDLYAKGAQFAKNMSSRMYSDAERNGAFGGYYRIWEQTRGMTPDQVAAFMQSDAVQQDVDRILKAEGALDNLSGRNLEAARNQVLNGIYNGIVYERSLKDVRDYGVPTWSERRADERAQRSQAVSEAMAGIKWVDGKPVYDPESDITRQRKIAEIQERAAAKGSGSGSGSSSSGGGNSRYTQLDKGARITWKGNNPESINGDADNDYEVEDLPNDNTEHKGSIVTYDDLPQYAKDKVDAMIGPRGDVDMYRYYFSPYKSGLIDDDEAVLEIIPHNIRVYDGSTAVDENDEDLE